MLSNNKPKIKKNIFEETENNNNITLSDEQLNIINNQSHALIDAVAGSGKTTTILHLAKKYPDKNIIQITYNNMLKTEVRKKVRRLFINNMEVHTYHSLAVKYYNDNAHTDEEIKKIVILKKPVLETPKIDILLIDETQDMSLDYYRLVRKFLSDTDNNPMIYVFGDRYQAIYEFKGASSKFLTLADKIWNYDFVRLTLSTSYRLTNQMSWFVNNVMLNKHRINTVRDGPKIDYYICNPFDIAEVIGKYIRNIIKDPNENIKENDIFILSPSIKNNEQPYKKLENYLVKNNIKCMTPISDDAKLDDKVINNKVVFTTFHQSKGRERKLVILYSFDENYFKYYLRTANKEECPNILYVATTRASYKLILLQDVKANKLPFLNMSHKRLDKYVNIINMSKDKNKINKTEEKEIKEEKKKTTVTDLIKFMSSDSLDSIILLTKDLFKITKKSNILINIPSKIKIDNNNNNNNNNKKEIYEDVSDLNGLVIPAIYEKQILNRNSTIEDYVEQNMEEMDDNMKRYIGKINIPCKKISEYLKVGNLYTSMHNKLHAKIAQIRKYDWLNEEMVEKCHKNMDLISNKNLKFEITICNNTDINTNNNINNHNNVFSYKHHKYGIIEIGGRIDAMDNENIYEFKCVDNLSIDHKLQIIIYEWMWRKSGMIDQYGMKEFYLMNIRTGEMLKLVKDYNKIDEIIEVIIEDKYNKKEELNEEEFLNKVK